MSSFEDALASARTRLGSLRSGPLSSFGDPNRILSIALQELEVALEELGVAGEELQQSNDELVTTRQELERERERYRQLFEFAPTGYLVTDRNGVIEEMNRAAVRLLHAPLGRPMGRPIVMFLVDEDRAGFRSRLAALETDSGSTEREWEVRLKRHESEPVTALLSVSTEKDGQGGTARYRWLLRDITAVRREERDRTQFQERLARTQRLEAIGQLAGGVAHDFNNSLTVITGCSRLLLDELSGEPQRERVMGIMAAAQRSASLTRQLLAFSRKQVVRPRVLDLNALIRGLRSFLGRLIGDDIHVAFELADGVGYVRADEAQFEQVLLNLAANARDAMPGGGTITVRTKLVEFADESEAEGLEIPPGSYVEIAVEDTGVGMDLETLEHIFEPFFTTKSTGQGTGLGLASAHGAVRQIGGDMRVATEPGEGTVFRVYLPSTDEAPEEPTESIRGSSDLTGSETILIAEDDPCVREVAAETLTAAGYMVLLAESGNAAVEAARAHTGPIDLVLTDVLMPGISGPELASQILKSAPDTRILFMSGYPGETLSSRCELDPSVPFLPKPFGPDRLLSAVRKTLNGD